MKRIITIFIASIFLVGACAAAIMPRISYIVPVMMYHSVDTKDAITKLSVNPKSFARQIEFLKNNKYNVTNLGKVALYLEKKERLPAKTIAITFDDGLENNYIYAFPVLKKYAIPATIFVIVDRIGKPGYLNWKELKEMADSGVVTIGSHTMSHQFLTSLDAEGIKKELGNSKKILEDSLGKKVEYLCYPMGRHTELVKKIAKETGYVCAVTTGSSMDTVSNDDIYAIKRVRVSRTSDNLFTFWLKTSGYYLSIKGLTDK